jgi:ABC-2 type transport system ATP-binding protein
MTKNDTLCSCSGITKSFGKKQVLNGCDFQISSGELVGLAGENGSGKSTLIGCLVGILKPDNGRVNITTSVGYCPQKNFLVDTYTVREHFNLFEMLDCSGGKELNEWRSWLLDLFKLTPSLDDPIGTLSGGTYQKVKFLTSLYHRPDLVLLDEPYDGFDWQIYQTFWELVGQVKSEGCGILLVSHFMHEHAELDRIHELKDGRLTLS